MDRRVCKPPTFNPFNLIAHLQAERPALRPFYFSPLPVHPLPPPSLSLLKLATDNLKLYPLPPHIGCRLSPTSRFTWVSRSSFVRSSCSLPGKFPRLAVVAALLLALLLVFDLVFVRSADTRLLLSNSLDAAMALLAAACSFFVARRSSGYARQLWSSRHRLRSRSPGTGHQLLLSDFRPRFRSDPLGPPTFSSSSGPLPSS